MRVWFVLAAVLCLCTPAAAADFNRIGPLATAPEILAYRNTGNVPYLKIVFERSLDGLVEPAKLALGPDFVVLDLGHVRTILDYRLRRRITIDAATKTFSNVSLYAEVDFLQREAINRRVQRAALVKLGKTVPPDIADPWWVQGELRLLEQSDEAVDLDRDDDKGAVRFSLKNEEVARFQPADTKLSPEESAGFAHFLLACTMLHPTVMKAIVDTGKIPQAISYQIRRAGKRSRDSLELKSVEHITGAYPLPRDYQPDVEDQGSVLAPVLPAMREAVARHTSGAPRSIAFYRKAMTDALGRNAILQQNLLWLELLMQYGESAVYCPPPPSGPCTPKEDLLAKWNGDPATKTLIDASAAEEAGDIKKALDLRLSVKRDGLSNAYVLDEVIGNTYVEGGAIGEGIDRIRKAILGNPYVAAFYKDLGDALRSDFDSFDAWTCYDLGRSLPGGENTPVINVVNLEEQELAKRYPQFF